MSFRYGPPTRTDNRVVVENLSSRVSWQVSDFNKQLAEILIGLRTLKAKTK